MRVQVVTRNAGVGPCASCKDLKPRVMISVSADHEDHPRSVGVSVCLDCLQRPGVSFDVDLGESHPTSAVGRKRVLKWSQKEEARAAAAVGGRTTKASGATNQDGDVKTKHFMIEQKMSAAKRLTVSNQTINKAAAQAGSQGLDWVLRFKLTHLDADLAVMRWVTASTLIKQWEEE